MWDGPRDEQIGFRIIHNWGPSNRLMKQSAFCTEKKYNKISVGNF